MQSTALTLASALRQGRARADAMDRARKAQECARSGTGTCSLHSLMAADQNFPLQTCAFPLAMAISEGKQVSQSKAFTLPPSKASTLLFFVKRAGSTHLMPLDSIMPRISFSRSSTFTSICVLASRIRRVHHLQQHQHQGLGSCLVSLPLLASRLAQHQHQHGHDPCPPQLTFVAQSVHRGPHSRAAHALPAADSTPRPAATLHACMKQHHGMGMHSRGHPERHQRTSLHACIAAHQFE